MVHPMRHIQRSASLATRSMSSLPPTGATLTARDQSHHDCHQHRSNKGGDKGNTCRKTHKKDRQTEAEGRKAAQPSQTRIGRLASEVAAVIQMQGYGDDGKADGEGHDRT
jgi:hypothetical protein